LNKNESIEYAARIHQGGLKAEDKRKRSIGLSTRPVCLLLKPLREAPPVLP